MIEYIKAIIISLISGVTFALPVSSAAHFSFTNSVVKFSEDTKSLGLYYSVMAVAFSAVIMILLRKIYSLCVQSVFDKSKKLENYRRVMKKLLISLVPSIVLFVPVSKERLLCDLFDNFLASSNLLMVAIACVIGALVTVVSVWYTKQSYSVTKRSADTKTVIRSSLYQIVSYVIPGFSHVTSAGTNMLICDVESKVIVREIYLYIAPQMLLVNIIKIIRYVLSDMIINPVMLIICFAVAALMSAFVVTAMSKINIRRLLPFFAGYSAFTGVIFAIMSFVLK
ncbi:MAG: hypothetical protein IJB74_00890 [Clostridia bacterium]|nr:hypothetical protein [Clostridia bacterium]